MRLASKRPIFHVPFEWNRVGGPPAANEVEVSIFGPGFGECVVLHVGGGRWLVVDSCIDSADAHDRRPVAERYLRAIGVEPESQVDLVVASHWHDDHVRGLGRLVEVCRESQFTCANSMLKEEFYRFIEEMGTGSAATDGAKVREFGRVLRHLKSPNRTRPRYATAGREIRTWDAVATQHGERCVVRALSPSDAEFEAFLLNIAALLPGRNAAKRAAPRQTPNLASIVLHVQFESAALLLCADMELHHDHRRGWNAVVDEGRRLGVARASALKVAHHGSANGHHGEAWVELLAPMPVAVVTPYNRLPVDKKLPTLDDLVRLRGLSSRLFLTAPRASGARTGVRDAAVRRGLRDHGIETRDLATSLGMVRLRRKVGLGQQWGSEAFAPAAEWNT